MYELKMLSIIILLLLLMSILYSPIVSAELFKQENTFTEYIVENYLTKIILDKSNGGIVKSYIYGNYKVSNLRYLAPGTIAPSILYEIIPPLTSTGTPPPVWWPGEVFGKKIVFNVVEENYYRLKINASFKISSVYEVELNKIYTFYYDRPYFDIEYRFINREDKTLKIDLSSIWNRRTSFSIEIATSFAGDADDDYQIYGTTEGKTVIRQGYSSPGEADIVEGKIAYIAMASSHNDYRIPQAIIVIPLEDTINETLGVWFEQAGLGLEGVPVSSVVRLEIKAFSLGSNDVKTYKFRVYMGPLIKFVLQELNLAPLLAELTKRYNIPDSLPNYTFKTEYKLSININPDNKNLYPNATLTIYRVMEDGSFSKIDSFPVEPRTLTLSQPGIYKIVIAPGRGMTRDGKHLYTNITIGNQTGSEFCIPVYDDTSITLNVNFELVVWLHITFIDENDQLLSDISQYPVTVVFESETGRVFTVNISSPDRTVLLPPGRYKVTVKSRNINGRTISDVYFNNDFVIYDLGLNTFSFDIDVSPNPVDQWIILRFTSVRVAGTDTTVVFYVILSFIILVIALIVVMIYSMRRRRI